MQFLERIKNAIKLSAALGLPEDSAQLQRKIILDNLIFDKIAATPLLPQIGKTLLLGTAAVAPTALFANFLLSKANDRIEEQRKKLLNTALLGAAAVTALGIGLHKLLPSEKKIQTSTSAPPGTVKSGAWANYFAILKKLATVGAVDALLYTQPQTEKIATARILNRAYGVRILYELVK